MCNIVIDIDKYRSYLDSLSGIERLQLIFQIFYIAIMVIAIILAIIFIGLEITERKK